MVAEDEGGFVAPSVGIDLALSKVKGSLLSGLHAAVGDYEMTFRLLQKQIALINPAPLKAALFHTFAINSAKVSLVTNATSANVQLLDNGGKPVSPIKLALLTAIHKV